MAKIMEVALANKADASVFEVPFANQADLCWYELPHREQAEGDTHWCFVNYEADATFRIFRVKYVSQEAVGLGASIAKIGPSEDSFCRICSPIARLWGKKTVKNGPLRPICSRRFPSPTASWADLKTFKVKYRDQAGWRNMGHKLRGQIG